MSTVDELWQMAHDFYAIGRASRNPSMRRMLMTRADNLLRQAAELRRRCVVTRSVLAKSDTNNPITRNFVYPAVYVLPAPKS